MKKESQSGEIGTSSRIWKKVERSNENENICYSIRDVSLTRTGVIKSRYSKES